MDLKKWLILVFLLIIAAIGTCTYKAISSFSFLEEAEVSSLADLKENLSKKETQIKELKRYYNSIVPPGKEVFIEFGKEGDIDIFRIHTIDSSNFLQSYADDRTSEKSMLDTLRWDEKTLETLRMKLKEANCISITNGEPANIGFKRSGMGKYFYNIFDKPIQKDKVSSYNDSCRYIYQNSTTVFEYGGGAIGPQCFPDCRKNLN